MNQNELEKKAAELHNEQTSLISEYVKAMQTNDSSLMNSINENWTILCHELKSINRRITLLKNQRC